MCDKSNGIGFCRVGDVSYVARAALHMWEEPFISCKNGSGTIFFCGCNLRCIFCQNYEISTYSSIDGAIPTDEESLSDIMLKLQQSGAHNINFVTPTPHVPLIASSVIKARSKGLQIPIAFNTNSYISISALQQLNGLVDIYMPDLKYATPAMAKLVSGAENYPSIAVTAIEEMYKQCGNITLDEHGSAIRGVVIRHLVLPGNIAETRRVLDIISERFPSDIHISLMAQYFPAHNAHKLPPFDRRLTPREYERAVDYAFSLGFSNVLIQELTSADEDYVPQWGEFING